MWDKIYNRNIRLIKTANICTHTFKTTFSAHILSDSTQCGIREITRTSIKEGPNRIFALLNTTLTTVNHLIFARALFTPTLENLPARNPKVPAK